ncbi:LuxR C-terminal-related transcriptional regulator [Bradyrhizobium sp. LA6.12]|uniref:LuxR C-terminal-related transcriptional regulator n=1 Tax=unclassified Bradyrhizobium TaxID=2631580 RepID=UPI0033950FEE
MREAFLSHLATLSPRERQVFELVIRGKINKQIASALGTTERTIKAHRSNVRKCRYGRWRNLFLFRNGPAFLHRAAGQTSYQNSK